MLLQMFGVTSTAADFIRNIILHYGSFGVAHEGTSDGMDAVSAAQRKAGFWANMFPKVLHVSNEMNTGPNQPRSNNSSTSALTLTLI